MPERLAASRLRRSNLLDIPSNAMNFNRSGSGWAAKHGNAPFAGHSLFSQSLDFFTKQFQVPRKFREDRGRGELLVAQKAEEQMLRADISMFQSVCFVAGGHENALGMVAERQINAQRLPFRSRLYARFDLPTN